MAYPWFKFFGGDYLHDEKLLGMDGHVRSCWLTLLCYAATSENQGTVRYLTEDHLMIQAGVPMGGEEWARTKGVLARFVERDMITVEDGVIKISNWDKRQASHSTSAERMSRLRHKRDTNVTLEEEVEEEVDKEKKNADAPPNWEKKIRNKDPEYQALVQDLRSCDFLTAKAIHDIVLNKFLPHWLERSEGARQARWQKEKAFDYRKRIRTWIENDHKYAKDFKCREGLWHRKGETCHCTKEELPPRREISPEAKALGLAKRVTHSGHEDRQTGE